MERLLRKGGSALIAGALLDLTGIVLYLAVGQLSPVLLTVASLLMIANICTAFGIIALYASQWEETGSLGLNAFSLLMIGLLLGVAKFYTPYTWIFYLIGLALMAVASKRAGHYSSALLWLWMLGGMTSLGGSISGIQGLLGLGTALSCFCRFSLGRSMVARFAR